MNGGGNPNVVQPVPHNNRHSTWHYLYFAYSRPRRQATAYVAWAPDQRVPLTFPNVNHYVSRTFSIYVAKDPFTPSYNGQVAHITAYIGPTAFDPEFPVQPARPSDPAPPVPPPPAPAPGAPAVPPQPEYSIHPYTLSLESAASARSTSRSRSTTSPTSSASSSSSSGSTRAEPQTSRNCATASTPSAPALRLFSGDLYRSTPHIQFTIFYAFTISQKQQLNKLKIKLVCARGK